MVSNVPNHMTAVQHEALQLTRSALLQSALTLPLLLTRERQVVGPLTPTNPLRECVGTYYCIPLYQTQALNSAIQLTIFCQN